VLCKKLKAILFANTEWYLYNFRLPLARALRARGFEVLLISPPGEYGERLRAEGFRWQPLPMDRRSLNPPRELGLLLHFTRLYRRERPDVVHHFTVKCVIYTVPSPRPWPVCRPGSTPWGESIGACLLPL
jgi:hypothetical protein